MGVALYSGKKTGANTSADRPQENLVFILCVSSSGNDFGRPKQQEFFQHKCKGGRILCQVILTMTSLSPELVAVVGVPRVIPVGLLAPVALYFTAEGRGTAPKGVGNPA